MNNTDHHLLARIEELCAAYGDGSDGAAPTALQWRELLQRPVDTPVTLVNLFRFRSIADYGSDGPAITGQEAFGRYAAVSVPKMQEAGGRFLFTGVQEGTFVGAAGQWDMVAVGTYPDPASLLALMRDPDYREAWHHRRAACAMQQVVVCGGTG